MKNFWRKLARALITTTATGVAAATTSGDPITSGTVLIPSLVAGVIAGVHAALPPAQPKPPR